MTSTMPAPVLVTGAGSGIGAAIAAALGRAGHPVGVTDLDRDAAAAVAQALERDGTTTAVAAELDVCDLASVQAGIDTVAGALGGVGGLVNNAGLHEFRWLSETDDALVSKLLAINLEGPIRVTREALPALRSWGSGRIVNIASDAARTGLARAAAYSSAKGGVMALTRSLARELARDAITVNCVSPGPIQTPLLDRNMAELGDAQTHLQRLTRSVPLRRIGEPEEIAAAVQYLVSPNAAYVTGQTLSVNGGAAIGS